MNSFRALVAGTCALTPLVVAACGGAAAPASPTPAPASPLTANVYILPGAVNLGPTAFGDEPVVIYRGEQMRFRNIDLAEHNVVADSAAVPEFMTTGTLAPGAERTFTMGTVGTVAIHCTIHPQMTGTLIVRER